MANFREPPLKGLDIFRENNNNLFEMTFSSIYRLNMNLNKVKYNFVIRHF